MNKVTNRQPITFSFFKESLSETDGIEFTYLATDWVAYYDNKNVFTIVFKDLLYNINIRDSISNIDHILDTDITDMKSQLLDLINNNEPKYRHFYIQEDDSKHVMAGSKVNVVGVGEGIIGYDKNMELCAFIPSKDFEGQYTSCMLGTVTYNKISDSPLESLWKNYKPTWSYGKAMSDDCSCKTTGDYTTTSSYIYTGSSEDEEYDSDAEYKLKKIKLLVDNFNDSEEDALDVLSIIGDIIR